MEGALLISAALSAPLWVIIALIVAIGVLIYLLITQWDELSTTVQQIGFIIGFYFNQLKDQISTTIEQLGFIISYYFTKAANALKEAFFSALDAVENKFQTIFNGVRTFVTGIINGIIDIINGMISGITNGINSIISGVNIVGSNLPGFTQLPTVEALQIPYLAKGAVIPPNSEFLAVLGDQRNGTNIEAPADLIRQIIREEMQGGGGDMVIKMPVYLDGEKVYENQQRVSKRRGASLAGGTI